MSSQSESRPNSKVARVIDAYDLEGFGDQLEREWIGQDGDRTSLRDLADVFNREVLRATIANASEVIGSEDVEAAYRLLTDEDVARGDRLRKRRDFEQRGVDVDRLLDDFVTHQAIHTYLTEYRGAELPDRDEDLAERKVELLERLQGRTTAVADSALEQLVNADVITDREYDVLVDVRVVCGNCGSDAYVGDLIREGGCDCETAESSGVNA